MELLLVLELAGEPPENAAWVLLCGVVLEHFDDADLNYCFGSCTSLKKEVGNPESQLSEFRIGNSHRRCPVVQIENL